MSKGEWLTSVHGIEGWLLRGVRGELLLEKGHPRAKKLAGYARKASVTTRIVTRSQLRHETGDPQARIGAFRVEHTAEGAIPSEGKRSRSGNHAGGRQAPKVSIEELCREADDSESVVLALDQVTDAHNVGAILRSCNWFGVAAVLVPDRRSAAINETVMHVSAGAAAHVRICDVVNLARALRELASAGFWVYGTDVEGQPCDKVGINRPTVVVLGSEGKGLRPNVKSACDELLAIPGHGVVESLNVSVATGVVLYELFVRRG